MMIGMGIGMGFGSGIPGGGAPAAPPVNSVAPVASGTARVGQTLSVTNGTWTGDAPISYTYQWRRGGVNIGSATNSTYVLVVADIGAVIDCVVTGTNASGSASQDSNDITVVDSLAASLASAVLDLDATKSASYSGSGTTWANMVAAPADGAAQTAYDFYRGDGATSTTYPTFNGSAGSADAYWSFDGGDYFKIKSGTNTAFLNNLHKTTGGADFWIAIAYQHFEPAGSRQFFTNTTSGSALQGVAVAMSSSGTGMPQFYQGAGASSNSSVNLAAAQIVGTNSLLIISYSHSSGNISYWLNTSMATTASFPFNTSTADPSGVLTIGATSNLSTFIGPSAIIYSAAMGNEYLDNTKAAAIIAHLEARHGRDYTP